MFLLSRNAPPSCLLVFDSMSTDVMDTQTLKKALLAVSGSTDMLVQATNEKRVIARGYIINEDREKYLH